MKIIYKIGRTIVIFIAIVSIYSCSDDFLDRNPNDKLSSAVFYQSKEDFDQALSACYSTFQEALFSSANPVMDCLTDNGQASFYSATSIAQGPITSLSGGYIDVVYTESYQNIARYNIFLKELSEYGGAVESWIKEFEAEVKFMRANRYFNLYKFYGSVPMPLEPVFYETQFQPKVDPAKIKIQILSDLDFAIANLPDKSFASGAGKLVKTSAQALKSRILLFDAYNDDGSAKEDVMQQVKSITSEIIAKKYYSIAPGFRAMFVDELGEQEGNPEFIFAIKWTAPTNFVSMFNGWGVAANYIANVSPGGGIVPYANLANSFEFIDGTPFSELNPLYDAADVYKNRDPRMAYTLFTQTAVFEDGFEFSLTAPSPTGYSYLKTIASTDAQNYHANLNGSYWPAIRYAEVLLMYAESTNEIDGPTSDVYDAINMIRDRDDVKMPPLVDGLSKDEMRNAIRHERRIELAFEGFRYDDGKRWKIADQLFTLPASEALIPKNFELKNYHWPLPQTEINNNNGILVQNPDYF
ncbi:RagB/SusD family nutrient uptake outer membrane protein [Reichenbachiella sp. MALMAid0571]|uniref:RagB/SusD family nutrient uptake outer membrane protein n=1 Tax=Reichenbachiella sp. MALMAid0571 TaxID=3143939 RepID=UPI0032DE8197